MPKIDAPCAGSAVRGIEDAAMETDGCDCDSAAEVADVKIYIARLCL